MTYKFLTQPLISGLYEPEGIYLDAPFEGQQSIRQFWGEHATFYMQFNYNGVPLKGHIGIDFDLDPGTPVVSVDRGRVMEISYERDSFERYLKLEHAWGESLYAYLGEIRVEAGQVVNRRVLLGYCGEAGTVVPAHLHFGIRIKPYNRFDGWGGFTDPLPFLCSTNILLPDEDEADTEPWAPPPMAVEKPDMRRP